MSISLSEINAIPAMLQEVQKVTLREKKALGVQLFGSSFAESGVPSKDHRAALNFNYSDYNVITYWSQVPNHDRTFVPFIGLPIRKVIGVSTHLKLVIEFDKFIRSHEQLKKMGAIGTLTEQRSYSPEWSETRLNAIRLILIKNLENNAFVTLKPESVVTSTNDRILITPPANVDLKTLQEQVHYALAFINIQSVIDVFNTYYR
jgi:hypothetical protein